ncbi:Hpt domain-containing protein [Treponema sp.]|uniref:Hpt domain-containing protein n=1 Tax=Treponema sp. TaxID=166 RepID=UPI00388EEDBA
MNEIFNRQAALDLVDNDEELLQILIDSFLEENKFEKSVLENLIREEKLSEAASYVHATKGAARQLCMEKLKNSGQELEDVLRGKKTGEILSLVNEMWDDYTETLSVLKS